MNYYLMSLHNQNYIYENNDVNNISINMRPFDDEFAYLSSCKNDLTVINFSYHPFLLYLLHNKGLYSVPCINIFDKVLDIKHKHIVPFNLENFRFEDNIEWTFTPYNILGTDFNKKNAVAKVTNDGLIYAIDIYKDNELSTRYYIDCRGFVSSRWSVINNKLLEGTFFNPNGEEIFKLNDDGSVNIINNAVKEKYLSSYNNIYDFLLEVFKLSIKITSRDFCLAEFSQSNYDLLNSVFDSKNASYVYFDNNTDDSEIKKLIESIDSSSTLYVDTPNNISMIHRHAKSDRKYDIKVINAFDHRIKTNESNFVGYNKILIYVDRDLDEQLDAYINCVFGTIKKISKPHITFIYKNKIDELLKSTIIKYSDKYHRYINNDTINFVCLYDDIQLFRELSDTRIFINTSNSIDVYFQQSVFRAAIPQINFTRNGNINEKKNGITVNGANELAEAMLFYINHLDNWNRTFTYCKKTYGD